MGAPENMALIAGAEIDHINLVSALRDVPDAEVKDWIRSHFPRADGQPLSDREIWLIERTRGIGGSDIATIAGLNKWKTPQELYMEKRGHGLLVDNGQSEAAFWGTTLEDVVAKVFAERTGMRVQRVNAILRHDKFPWMAASIDRAVVNPDIAGTVRVLSPAKRAEAGRLLSTDQILEVKTANAFSANRDWGKEQDAVPMQYVCQTQWYLGITGASICHLAVLIGGQQFRKYVIPRDDALIEHLQDVARKFWFDHVIAGVEPDPHSAREAAARWPVDDGSSIEADNELAARLGDLPRLEAEAAEIKEQIDDIKDSVRLYMQDHASLTLGGNSVATFKASKPKQSFDGKALQAEQPEIYAQYLKTGAPVRTLRFK